MFNQKKRCNTAEERTLMVVLKEKGWWAVVWFGRSLVQKAANGMEMRAGKAVECLAGLNRFSQFGKVREISEEGCLVARKADENRVEAKNIYKFKR